jgi:AraC-like DNA-binding protein
MVIRADTPGFSLRIGAGQVLRHVCISMYRDNIKSRIKSALPHSLEELINRPGPVDVALPLPTTDLLKDLANELYNTENATGLNLIRSEATAIRFLIETLDLYGQSHTYDLPNTLPAMGWRKELLQQIKTRIHTQPNVTLADLLNEDARRISPATVRQLFQSEYGISLSAYHRHARMDKARRLLEAEEIHIKQVAYDTGYAHIGNFTRAYRNHFGEAPSRTRRRIHGH